MSAEPLRGAKIVVTGVTGQVGEPVARALARDNEVYGAARFRDDAARERLEAAGVTCVRHRPGRRRRGRASRPTPTTSSTSP